MIQEQIVRRIGRRLIRWWTPLRLGFALLALAFLIGVLGYFNQRGRLYLPETLRQIVAAFDTNAVTELVSIAATILIVDRLYERRETEREKRRLILQMGSPDNVFAREAVRALRARGWLEDGSVKFAILSEANLHGADLTETNLCGAYLLRANLQSARLVRANLKGAFLVDANLQGAFLVDANLQDAFLARANLLGAPLWRANLRGADLQGADLAETILEDAEYDNTTVWPEGFTPPPEAVNVDAEEGKNGL